MNKDQLKKSLHELTPTENQKQNMLRNIRQAQPEEKKLQISWLWRITSVAIMLVIVIGLWQLMPHLQAVRSPEAPEEAVPADVASMDQAVEEEAAAPMAAEESQNKQRMANEDSQMFDLELAETPWQSDRVPQSLPIFMLGMDVVSATEESETSIDVDTEQGYINAIVDYSVNRLMEEADHQLVLSVTDQVAIISFDEAKERLIQQTADLKLSDIQAGYLSYTRPTESELIHPIYRFRYELDGEIHETYVDARQ